MISHITEVERGEVARARNFGELSEVALRVLKRLPDPVSIVCGPITTGGTGSTKENIRIFARTISLLGRRGENVFSQMPFERPFSRLIRQRRLKNPEYNGYCWSVLYDFYFPLFKSGKIKRAYFLPGWRLSVGAKWEFETAGCLGIYRIPVTVKVFTSEIYGIEK